jgi:hypothetical protein
MTQDEIVERLLTTLRLQLSVLRSGVPSASIPHGADNPEAYDYYLRGTVPFFSGTKRVSVEMIQHAIELDPKCSYACAVMGSAYALEVLSGTADRWTTLGIESRYSSRRPFDSFGSAENEWRLLKEHHRA